ncbi:caspase family protein [Scytonema sp. UIC 10036]|uniref:caspase family protein n=1 Tax=Scytonema sp. UIC 10036 TaxID=2304196 RepID=UPI0012DAEED2|nr:caspase family protein [Scytonema sp. UIC 10036]MUH00922.1 caspase family protein [Scytonema sp. UIC 10036]
MTNQTDSLSNFYALLIGIDNYLPNPWYGSLGGCVRDIQLVEGYLQNTLKIPSERIFKLTSPLPNAVDSFVTQDSLPTYENIVKAFSQLTEKLPENAQVYIHYSGHGGFATTIYPELKRGNQPDEAIVPMDIGESQARYLRDVELATLIKRMTDKGLIVTVILDSCHSGGATRGDDSVIRGLDGAPDDTPRNQESLVGSREELIANWRLLTQGVDASSLSGKWLPQTRDYVLLAACRPSELAREYAVNGKDRHGALTYWTIDTLTSSVSGLTYKSLHDRVSAKIQSKFPQKQTPMLLGESGRFVFGSDSIQLQFAVNVLEVVEENSKPKSVQLNAGLAQGLTVGTRFAIYPLGTTDFTDKEKIQAIVEIRGAGAAKASAEVIEIVRQEKIEAGAQAVMQSAPVNLIRGVRLFKKQVGDKDNELPPELVDKQDEALKAVERFIEGNGWLKLVSNEQEKADYQVAINRKSEYEICLGIPIENLRPALTIGDSDAARKVVQRLVHLAKYQAVQEIDNQFSTLGKNLEVELLTQENWQPGDPIEPHPFSDRQNPTIDSGDYVFLRIKNISSSKTFNIVALDSDATWAISQIALFESEAIFEEFQPGREEIIPLQLTVPDGKEYEKVKESIKVFALLGAADFRWLELPSLDEPTGSRSANAKQGNSPLEKLMEAIGADADAQPPEPRAAVRVFDPNQEWTTKQVTINIINN